MHCEHYAPVLEKVPTLQDVQDVAVARDPGAHISGAVIPVFGQKLEPEQTVHEESVGLFE